MKDDQHKVTLTYEDGRWVAELTCPRWPDTSHGRAVGPSGIAAVTLLAEALFDETSCRMRWEQQRRVAAWDASDEGQSERGLR